MSKAGAPLGNQNAAARGPKRRARNALCRVLLASKLKGTASLDTIWKKQVELAEGGDAQATKLIIETLDGKPAQQQHITGQLDTTVLVEIVRNASNPPTS